MSFDKINEREKYIKVGFSVTSKNLYYTSKKCYPLRNTLKKIIMDFLDVRGRETCKVVGN